MSIVREQAVNEQTRHLQEETGVADTGTVGRPTTDSVYRAFAGPLTAFVRNRVSDPHAVEDIVAEVMLRIHEHLDHLDDHERVTAWVYRIARNTIIDHYRRRSRRPEDLDAGPTETVGSSGADEWIDDQAATLSDLAEVLRPLVQTLPPQYRRALELTDLGGMTQAEAARIELVSVSGMKSRVQRARRQVAAQLSANCEITVDGAGVPNGCVPRVAGCACGGPSPR